MNYNSSFKYNYSGTKNAAFYNSTSFRLIVYLWESLKTKDSTLGVIVKKLILEEISVPDVLNFFVLHNNQEFFELEDSSKNLVLIDLLEKYNLYDDFSSLFVVAYLSEGQKVIDEIKSIEAILEKEESLNFQDKSIVLALIEMAEKYDLPISSQIFSLINQFEYAKITDKEPRKAVSDFVIGQSDDKDSAFDWVIPFDMKIDWKNSSIQVMPQTESSYIDMPGNDGSIIEDTVYKNRLFSIVAFSELGLSLQEKQQLKRDIAQILDSTKNNPKKLTFQSAGTSFDVIYSGSANIVEGPSYVKATIPFEASPYGYPLFEREIEGSGLVVNDGDADVGCVHHISSGAVNPSFQLGSITYKWSGTVPQNSTLVIDHNNYTCYLEEVKGTKTNVIDKLTGEFQTIPKQTSIAITAIGDTKNHIVTTIQEKILW